MAERATLTEVVYVHNQICRGLMGGYYFVTKAKVLPGGALFAIGKKYDVTESIEALFKSKKKAKPR